MSTTSEIETTIPIPTAELSESERHRLLSDRRRRIVLELLAERDEPLTLTELVVDVDARENNGGSAAGRIPEEIEITLHHVHLPMMADLGVIDYDSETNRIDPR